MNTIGKLLELIYCRIPPERVLRQIYKEHVELGSHSNQNAVFLRFAESTLSGYSADEQTQLYLYLKNITKELSMRMQVPESAFFLLVHYGKHVLDVDEDIPLCKYTEVLKWREVYHILGQDQIVCALMAYNDIISGKQRLYFDWPATLHTNYTVLDKMLEKGVAENHCHLNGSTQSFAISWLKLMNYPGSATEWIDSFDTLLQSAVSRGEEDNMLPLEERVLLAAAIRIILFKSIHREAFSTDPEYFDSKCEFLNLYNSGFCSANSIGNAVQVMRKSWGMPIPAPNGSSMCMDYALYKDIFYPVADSPYRLLAGERSFLYQCFCTSFSGKFSKFENDLLYLYLLIKNAFRAEMIQVNRQVGFQNFANYEARKDRIWEEDAYWWEAYRMALNAPIKLESVESLESRFCPTATPSKLERKVAKYDLAKWFADRKYEPEPVFIEREFEQMVETGGMLNEPHFYVLHFPKQNDVDPIEIPLLELQSRHQRLRAEVKQKTLATEDALIRSDYLCSRIRGIDACANEVNCRPEVFATAFRYLSNLGSDPKPDTLLGKPISRLSLTYHAGEDFYDIADGLRAIDEAVYFLEFKRSNRIGHALALGVDPEIHYQTKHGNIILPKQNYLDNLIWLLFRGREINLQINPHQYGIMKEDATRLLREIYGDAIAENNWSVTISEYYESMKLRGDEPYLYSSMKFQMPNHFGDRYDQYGISLEHRELNSIRHNDQIAGMYYYYHYGRREKIEGSKPVTVPITSHYITLMREAQNALQLYLAKKGVIIECNPSSNVLIGTFRQYEKHPIFRLNNEGLTHKNYKNNPQMHVCVNTDDLGVFDTSISFEYALLADALSQQLGSDGNPIYPQTEIMHYLDVVREMGLHASFLKADARRNPLYQIPSLFD